MSTNGKYHQMGVVLSAASLKWWIDQVQKDTSDPYQVLQAEAEKVKPGSEGLYFLPYLLGERTPYSDPNAKGCFIGLSISHSRDHMTRAVLEGVIYALREMIGTTKEIQPIKENVEIYNKHYNIYSKLYGVLQETFKDIAKL